MKNLCAAVTLGLAGIAASNAMADDNMFMGAEFGRNNIRISAGEETNSDKQNQYGIRFGSYLNEQVRAYVSLHKRSDYSDSVDLASIKAQNYQFLLSSDYLFDLGYLVKPFIGATVGFNRSKFKLTSIKTVEDTKYGFVYGAQAGLVAQVDQFDIELGYRYLKMNTKGDLTFAANAKLEYTLDYSKTPYLAVSYKF
ncbi:MAG: outer membrane beta-barrel protein [Endozoicomonas sp. (ex Botrylloides leachii)]|nr:outer membrane beta-barrel protein [Endozoicomonas sp. (ex Botrylloides leachii)]